MSNEADYSDDGVERATIDGGGERDDIYDGEQGQMGDEHELNDQGDQQSVATVSEDARRGHEIERTASEDAESEEESERTASGDAGSEDEPERSISGDAESEDESDWSPYYAYPPGESSAHNIEPEPSYTAQYIEEMISGALGTEFRLPRHKPSSRRWRRLQEEDVE